jgi:CRP-like cAMP-binding protein
MLQEQLGRLEPFAHLAGPALDRLARSARVRAFPAGRWLLRPGRRLIGHYFLLRGCVRIVDAGGVERRVDAGSERSRQPIYPGASTIATLSAVELLQVRADDLAPLPPDPVEPPAGAAALPEPPEMLDDDTSWQVRFLSLPLLQRLKPADWQRLLVGMVVQPVVAGQVLIRQGTPGDACYVLRAGRVRVHAHGRTLAVLEPGTLCGEDALITGGRRNASVTLLDDGAVGRLEGAAFERWLLNAVIQPLPRIGARTALDVGGNAAHARGCLHLPLARLRDPDLALSPRVAYCVVGGALRERWLAAFVLAQQGFDVLPLAPA